MFAQTRILKKARTSTVSTLALTLLSSGALHASPYHTTGFSAADRPELKIFSEYESEGDAWEVEGPALDVTLPLAPGLETSVTFGAGWLRDPGGPTQSGWLDTEWAVKWELMPVPEAGGFGITVEPAIFAPTGTNGIGDDEWIVEAPVTFGWEKDRISIRSFLAYAASLESSDDELGFGAVVEYEFTDRLAVGVELSGEKELLSNSDYELEGDIGFTYDMGNELELQGRISHSIHTTDNVGVFGFGLFLEKAF